MYSKDLKSSETSFLKSEEKSINISNPINPTPFVRDLNFLSRSAQTSPNKMYAGYNNVPTKQNVVFDYDELMKRLSTFSENKRSISELFYSIHNLFNTQFSTVFTALGLCNEDNSCINLRLLDSVGSTYTNKIFLKEETSNFITPFKLKNTIFKRDVKMREL